MRPIAPTLVRPCARTCVCVCFSSPAQGGGSFLGPHRGRRPDAPPPHTQTIFRIQLYPRVPDRSLAYALIIKQWDSFISLVIQMPKIWLIIRWRGFPSLLGGCLLGSISLCWPQTNHEKLEWGLISIVIHKFLAARLRSHLGSRSSG